MTRLTPQKKMGKNLSGSKVEGRQAVTLPHWEKMHPNVPKVDVHVEVPRFPMVRMVKPWSWLLSETIPPIKKIAAKVVFL